MFISVFNTGRKFLWDIWANISVAYGKEYFKRSRFRNNMHWIFAQGFFIAASFNDTRTLKFKAQPTNASFVTFITPQSSETKPSTKLVLVSRKPLLYFVFNKPNKQNVSGIKLFTKFNFSQSQSNCWHADWC